MVLTVPKAKASCFRNFLPDTGSVRGKAGTCVVGFLFSVDMHELSWPDPVKRTVGSQEELYLHPVLPAEGGQKTTEAPESRREGGKCADQRSKQTSFPGESLQAARATESLAHIPSALPGLRG